VADEWAPQHGGVAHRRGVDLRRLDERLHDRQVAVEDVHAGGHRLEEVRPGVPVADERLGKDVGFQVDRLGVHGLSPGGLSCFGCFSVKQHPIK
jgi:hypothetical protein